jgi:adenosylcobinamide-phosphate synthase
MISIYFGYFLNVIIGQIPYVKHPIILIGNLITYTENKLYKRSINKKIAGYYLLIIVAFLSWALPYILLNISYQINGYLGGLVNALMILEILAIKGLKEEPLKVYKALKNNEIDLARKELSMLVTRDTSVMNRNQIIMSTIETIAENIVDGVTAPLFYIFLGGAPLGFFYKAVNTLDSMVGYKNERYKSFGYYSAKFDDLLNYIPARITGYLIVLMSYFLKLDYKSAHKTLKEDAKKSSSPNSGFSEAPVAGALNVYFGGELKYFDKIVEKPKIGKGDDFTLGKIIDSISIMYYTSFASLLLYTFLAYMIGGFLGL